MFSQIKFVTGNFNKVRETGVILGVPLEQVKVDGLIEIQTQNIEELVYHKCQQAYDSLKCSVLVEDLDKKSFFNSENIIHSDYICSIVN